MENWILGPLKTSQSGILRLNSSYFQMFRWKIGSSDLSKECSKAKVWRFSDVRTKKKFFWTSQNVTLMLNPGKRNENKRKKERTRENETQNKKKKKNEREREREQQAIQREWERERRRERERERRREREKERRRERERKREKTKENNTQNEKRTREAKEHTHASMHILTHTIRIPTSPKKRWQWRGAKLDWRRILLHSHRK